MSPILFILACSGSSSCSDSQGHSNWDLISEAREPATAVTAGENECGQLSAIAPDATFRKIDEGKWSRAFPSFQAGCGTHQLSMTLDLTSKNASEWTYHSDFRVCNHCEEKANIHWLSRTYEPPGEITTRRVSSFSDSGYRPILVLVDQQGHRYPVGCASLTIGTGAENKWEVRQYELVPGDVVESSFTGELTEFFDLPLAVVQPPGDSEYWSHPVNYSDLLGADILWGGVLPEAALEATQVAARLEAACREVGYNVPSETADISLNRAFETQSVEVLGLPREVEQYLEDVDQSRSP